MVALLLSALPGERAALQGSAHSVHGMYQSCILYMIVGIHLMRELAPNHIVIWLAPRDRYCPCVAMATELATHNPSLVAAYFVASVTMVGCFP